MKYTVPVRVNSHMYKQYSKLPLLMLAVCTIAAFMLIRYLSSASPETGASISAHATREDVSVSSVDSSTPVPSLFSAKYSADKNSVQNMINYISESYGAVGVQVVVIQNGAIADAYAYGSATKDVQDMTVNTKIRIASISKVVLGMAFMSLQEDGVIDIDEDISNYWGTTIKNPYYKNIPVTIRSILSHTSSITVYGDGVSTSGTSIRNKLTSSSCFSRLVPGSLNSWGYNNYAFAVLGVTLENAADETVNSIMDREFFDLLDIDASFGSGNVDTGKLATLYYHGGSVAKSVAYQKTITGSTYPGQTGACFCGGLTISSYDLAKLVAVLANDGIYNDRQILSGQSVRLMETISEQKVPDQSFYQGLPLRYQTQIYGQASLYYHTGSSYGVYNCISYNPETKNGVIVLTTGASGEKDSFGIYKICGDINQYIYNSLRQ